MARILDEHYGYLSLKGRAEAFGRAFREIIRPGDVVADLGCGFGVLGLQAIEAGASHVFGIDQSDAIEIARETIRREGLEDRYTTIRGRTFEVDLPEKVDVLICDHIGFFGVDYGLLAMLADARTRFLKPGGRIVPAAIELLLAPAQNSDARAKADRWTRDPVPSAFHWLENHGVNSTFPHQFEASDLLGDAQLVAQIDLTRGTPESLSFAGELRIARGGIFHGLSAFFRSTLAEGVALTNAPGRAEAIARPQLFLPCREPFKVAPGERVAVKLTIAHDPLFLNWSVTPPAADRAQHMSTWHAAILTEHDLAAKTGEKLSRGRQAEARFALLRLLDGTRSRDEVETAMLDLHSDLFPSSRALRDFIRRELPENLA
ncbi:methyltransferase domain-containing protein [Aurantiacibacter gangjinensis]|uniref:methyltransferase domain-containing protein n=1 Tax=Aurantiacibacter gangjinensis TaxID=502682 RepID=UPI0006994E53|nr:methyltransferase domain-containing protein [Aurantiacibacter gangjinensis]APE27325.1 Protein arginine N-methyltransferase 1 [Aurantiacibacter gangjinensis]